MIIAGPCLYADKTDYNEILQTAVQLQGIADRFRCKIIGGGTTPEKYMPGIGYEGVELLKEIQKKYRLKCGTEVHTPNQVVQFMDLDFLWVGARNSQNYTLLEYLSCHSGPIFIKRGTGMTVEEIIGIYDIMVMKHYNPPLIVDRGVVNIDRQPNSRWSPDLKGIIQIKKERPDMFENLVIDCSHSVGQKDYIEDTYKAFKAIGVNHFMFECTASGKSKTDQGHMLSVQELKDIL